MSRACCERSEPACTRHLPPFSLEIGHIICQLPSTTRVQGYIKEQSVNHQALRSLFPPPHAQSRVYHLEWSLDCASSRVLGGQKAALLMPNERDSQVNARRKKDFTMAAKSVTSCVTAYLLHEVKPHQLQSRSNFHPPSPHYLAGEGI